DLKIALPWHAALRLYMVPAAELDSSARGLDLPVIDSLAPPDRGAGDCPVVMVAHGMKRAYLIADRLVWRLEAHPYETLAVPPAPALTGTVRTDEGEIYWVADPERLLERIESSIPGIFSMESKAPAETEAPAPELPV